MGRFNLIFEKFFKSNKMKKVSILAVTILALCQFSCKKDYTCECKVTSSVGNAYTTTREIPQTNKKTAKAICGNYSSVNTEQIFSASGTNALPVGTVNETTSATCTLK